MSAVSDTAAAPHSGGRHATNLELFVDLVFVFAITQITSVIAGDVTPAGVGKGALLAGLVWWLWSQYTWAGTALDLERNTIERVLVLGTIPPALVMTVAIPGAYDGTAGWFSGCYLAVQLLVIAMQGRTAWKDPAHRWSWTRYAPLAAVAPLVVCAGAVVHGSARTTLWGAAMAISVISGLVAGTRRNDGRAEWRVDPTHFSERHGLFVIICLGESLVAVGASATALAGEKGLSGRLAFAVACCVAFAALVWWVYFAFIPRVGEHQLARRQGGERARLARDIYTYFHFPVVFGIIMYAVVAKHVVAHPGDPIDGPDRWFLAGSALSIIGGLLLTQFRIVRRLAPERVLMIAATALLAFTLTSVDGAIVIAVLAAGLAAMQAVTWRRFAGSELGGEVLAGH
jgi:low temperature requirement protein LtrA